MSEGASSAKKTSVWYRRSRVGMLIGGVLLGSAIILRWKLGNAAVEQSSLYWLQPVAFLWMGVSCFVNLWTHPTDMFEPKPEHKQKDDTKE